MAFGDHRLFLSPRAGRELRLLSTDLVCAPAADLRETEDVFGNKVTLATFAATAKSLVVTNRLEIDLLAPEWPIFRIAVGAQTYPFSYSPDDIIDIGALREPDDFDAALNDWARGLVLREGTDTLSLLNDLNTTLHRSIDYRARDEAGTQAPHETLQMRSGSCRDIAALFIQAARILGLGARAVSGYAYDPHALTQTGGTTHAWAEVYLPEAGWIAFDPTHGRLGGANLIPTGVGRCNDQIMPITGSYSGAAEDFLGMDVAVTFQRQ